MAAHHKTTNISENRRGAISSIPPTYTQPQRRNKVNTNSKTYNCKQNNSDVDIEKVTF